MSRTLLPRGALSACSAAVDHVLCFARRDRRHPPGRRASTSSSRAARTWRRSGRACAHLPARRGREHAQSGRKHAHRVGAKPPTVGANAPTRGARRAHEWAPRGPRVGRGGPTWAREWARSAPTSGPEPGPARRQSGPTTAPNWALVSTVTLVSTTTSPSYLYLCLSCKATRHDCSDHGSEEPKRSG